MDSTFKFTALYVLVLGFLNGLVLASLPDRSSFLSNGYDVLVQRLRGSHMPKNVWLRIVSYNVDGFRLQKHVPVTEDLKKVGTFFSELGLYTPSIILLHGVTAETEQACKSCVSIKKDQECGLVNFSTHSHLATASPDNKSNEKQGYRNMVFGDVKLDIKFLQSQSLGNWGSIIILSIKYKEEEMVLVATHIFDTETGHRDDLQPLFQVINKLDALKKKLIVAGDFSGDMGEFALIQLERRNLYSLYSVLKVSAPPFNSSKNTYTGFILVYKEFLEEAPKIGSMATGINILPCRAGHYMPVYADFSFFKDKSANEESSEATEELLTKSAPLARGGQVLEDKEFIWGGLEDGMSSLLVPLNTPTDLMEYLEGDMSNPQ